MLICRLVEGEHNVMSKPIKIKRNTKIYRGRRRFPRWLIFALVLVLAVVIGFFGAKYISRKIAEIKENPPASSQESSQAENNAQSESESSEESKAEPEQEGMRAKVMPSEVLLDSANRQTFLSEAKSAGYNTVILELKDADGLIYYTTQNEVAVSAGAVVSGAVDLKTVCGEITAAGLTPAARMIVLRDPLAATTANQNTYLYNNQKNLSWLDDSLENGGKRWLNPYQENARAYIADLAQEMAEAGCKKIILEDMQYPDVNQYGMGVVNEYASRLEVLKQLYEEVKAKAAASGAEVWTQWRAETYFGLNETYYGGSPEEIGSDKVVLDISLQILQNNRNLEVLKGIDVSSAPEQAVNAVLKAISKESVEIAPVVETNGALSLESVYTENKISNFIDK